MLRQCGGSGVRFTLAAGPSRQFLKQNHTGIMGFQCRFEFEIRWQVRLQQRRISDLGR
jgi:hypothetical protein